MQPADQIQKFSAEGVWKLKLPLRIQRDIAGIAGNVREAKKEDFYETCIT